MEGKGPLLSDSDFSFDISGFFELDVSIEVEGVESLANRFHISLVVANSSSSGLMNMWSTPRSSCL